MSPSCSYDDDTAEAATANLDNSGRETSSLISASLVPAIILARGGGKHEEQHGQHDEAREHVEEDDAEGACAAGHTKRCHARSVANSATSETRAMQGHAVYDRGVCLVEKVQFSMIVRT